MSCMMNVVLFLQRTACTCTMLRLRTQALIPACRHIHHLRKSTAITLLHLLQLQHRTLMVHRVLLPVCWTVGNSSNVVVMWSCQSTLATSARAHPVQDRRTDIQGSARHSATVPWTTRPSSRSARSAGTPLCQLQSPGGADVPTVYSLSSF